ncbi:MAG: putative nuclease [Satyrvirus sp.]|uniref:Putative nuclease n=1 Tax=Satyrvirus sp. TaxID=2487771 RepID=A0A3G5AEL0_9VIRU|nr:MAG: putative nuclease [Satyrvirus sp.]
MSDSKKCTKCSETKPISEFYVCKGDKIRSSCKKCDNAMTRSYKARHRKHISEYNQKYKADHREEISVYNHEYNKNNREAIQERQTRTHKIRRKTDKNYKTAIDLRWLVYNLIKDGEKYEKISKVENLIGCSYHSFMIWLRYLFDDKMKISNYGKHWSMDHVIPCCMYDLTDKKNQYKCFHWSNLRPLEKMKNYKKTNKIDIGEVEKHVDLLEYFLETLPKEERKEYTLLD